MLRSSKKLVKLFPNHWQRKRIEVGREACVDDLFAGGSGAALKSLCNSAVVRNDTSAFAKLLLLFEKDKTLW